MGGGGACLESQARGRWISELKSSLVVGVSSRTARVTQKPCLEKGRGLHLAVSSLLQMKLSFPV